MNISFRSIIQDSINFIRNHPRSTIALLLLLTFVRIITDHFMAPYLEQMMQLLYHPSTTTVATHLTPQVKKSSVTFLILVFIQALFLITFTLSFIHQNSLASPSSLRQYFIRFISLLLPMSLYFIITTLFAGILLSLLSMLFPASSFVMLIGVFLILLFACLGPIIIVLEHYSAMKALFTGIKIAARQCSLLIPLFILTFMMNILLSVILLVTSTTEINLINYFIAFIYNFLRNGVLLFILLSLYRIYMLQK